MAQTGNLPSEFHHVGHEAQTPAVVHEMTEEERIKRIIDTIVHEEGHEAIKEPLYAEAHMDYVQSESPYAYFSHFLPDPRIEEHGAMLVEGIPMSELDETKMRRGKYEQF